MKMNSCITLTFCECSENHVGMSKNGIKSINGYSYNDLDNISQQLLDNYDIERYNLLYYLNQDDYNDLKPELLVVRNYLHDNNQLFQQLKNLEWDRKYYDTRRQKVLNKRARANLCFSNYNQEPDYENKKGRIVSYSNIKELEKLKKNIEKLTNDQNQECEGNLYDDISKNGIGWHGDSERKKVIGIRLGESAELKFRWYINSEIKGDTFSITLNSGDLYIMSEKTTGHDWKKKKIYTLRHSAISSKYTK